MITELITVAITISGIDVPQIHQVFNEQECVAYESYANIPMFSFSPIQTGKKKTNTYNKYLAQYHTAIAIMRTGHKRVIYWKRIRSRTWKKKNVFQLEELTTILIVIAVI